MAVEGKNLQTNVERKRRKVVKGTQTIIGDSLHIGFSLAKRKTQGGQAVPIWSQGTI